VIGSGGSGTDDEAKNEDNARNARLWDRE